MLFLPECLGFMGDNAEHTLQNADPPITELIAMQSKMNDCSSSLDTTTESSLLFRTEISRAIADGSQEIDVGDDIIDYTNYGGDKNESRAIKSIITELCYIAKESKLWISGGGVLPKHLNQILTIIMMVQTTNIIIRYTIHTLLSTIKAISKHIITRYIYSMYPYPTKSIYVKVIQHVQVQTW